MTTGASPILCWDLGSPQHAWCLTHLYSQQYYEIPLGLTPWGVNLAAMPAPFVWVSGAPSSSTTWVWGSRGMFWPLSELFAFPSSFSLTNPLFSGWARLGMAVLSSHPILSPVRFPRMVLLLACMSTSFTPQSCSIDPSPFLMTKPLSLISWPG